ncbi:ubiquitin carboxyl-terminal hydrolase 37 [Lates calcarifer]|uniref:Ubiquitin carboxyl-terminal hydrolase 37 n=1 Tax=Lates calcarifer TaxID=8187 RepID=A0AAJ7LRW7_LATCA|nr:ubiquitin carboxyl-terminal hydrolase 37 [Lates calcarifer]
MFRLCCGKYSTAVIELVADKIRSVPAPDAPSAIQDKDITAPLRYRLFGRPLTKTRKEDSKNEKENATTSDGKKKKKKKTKKGRWWRCSKKTCRVTPAPEEESPEKCRSPALEEGEPQKDGVVPQALPKEEEGGTRKKLRKDHLKCLGFPNPAQICYLNSSLQSLLTLEDFVKDIEHQEQVWSLVPEAAILRSFFNIREHHFSSDAQQKLRLLATFKKVVALWAPEFEDLQQKDAHEFLTSVLEQMRYWGPQLQVLAAGMGRTYRCPVEEHLVFKMQNTRTCKSCGAGSSREEDFTCLSLDLPPGGATVERLLENYLMEEELEYRCNCGATTSGQRSSFTTLPRVLMLHLKRFKYTPTFELQKVHDPVVLQRELVVSSSEGAACYTLVSTISHIGRNNKKWTLHL